MTEAEMSGTQLADQPITLTNNALVIPSSGIVVAMIRDELDDRCGERPASHLEAIDIASGDTRWRANTKGVPVGTLGDNVLVASAGTRGKPAFESLAIADGRAGSCVEASPPVESQGAWPSNVMIHWPTPATRPYVSWDLFTGPTCHGGAALADKETTEPPKIGLLVVELREGPACSFAARVEQVDGVRAPGTPFGVRLPNGWIVRGEDHDSPVIPAGCTMIDAKPSDECLYYHRLVARRPDGTAAWERVWSKERRLRAEPP